jgi:hypothetical protein
MLPTLSRGLRFALVLSMSLGFVAWHGQRHAAYAEDDEDGGGDDEGGDDAGAKPGGDEEDAGGGEDDEDAKTQPAVTSGGLFTLATYPVSEILRPLTMTQKIVQLRLAVGTDISAKGAFGSAGVNLEGIYGVTDNVSVIGGLTSAYNFKQFGLYFGIEGALAYDFIDFRLAANIHRNAIPRFATFCNPPAMPNEMPVGGACTNSTATQDNLPSGKYDAGGTKFSIDLGFPFRYAIKPEIAIVALQTLMSIDFNAVKNDFVQVVPIDSSAGGPTTKLVPKGNSAKPDLNPSLGIATNPIPALSVVIFGQFRIPDFDTAAGGFQVPVTARVEFSPNQKFDVGLEFTLLNVKPPEGQSPIDNRFISLFIQSRFGH